MFNTLGNLLSLTTFGESHGAAYGGIINNFPAGLTVDLDQVQYELDRRKPGQSAIVTQRKESDTVKFLSGIFEGKTTGTPIGFIIENENQKSKDYDHIANAYRPSHADFTYDQKFGIRDYRGGENLQPEKPSTGWLPERLPNSFYQTLKSTLTFLP